MGKIVRLNADESGIYENRYNRIKVPVVWEPRTVVISRREGMPNLPDTLKKKGIIVIPDEFRAKYRQKGTLTLCFSKTRYRFYTASGFKRGLPQTCNLDPHLGSTLRFKSPDVAVLAAVERLMVASGSLWDYGIHIHRREWLPLPTWDELAQMPMTELNVADYWRTVWNTR